MSSWEYSFATTIKEKKKKVTAGRPVPKLSELTELILKFSFDLEQWFPNFLELGPTINYHNLWRPT